MSVQSIHQFSEKVALISDASSPVGRAVAMQLALNGCYVIGLFPNGGSVAELTELGTLAHALTADPSTSAGAALAADSVDKLFGRLDLLVNCLKFRCESSFDNLDESVFLDTMNRSLGSIHYLTNGVLRLMKARPKPKIVNVVSVNDHLIDPLYAASQMGIIGLTGALATTLPRNFRINCVQWNDSCETSAEASGLMLRPEGSIAPDDVGRTVLFLLSSESAGMNGQVIKLG